MSSTHQLYSSFVGLEFGELHLCSDSTSPPRQRGRSRCHKRKDIFWSCGQYSESKLFTSVIPNCNTVWPDHFSTEKEIIPPVMYFNYWYHCVCVPLGTFKAGVKRRTNEWAESNANEKTLCSPSLAFDSAHVKYGVWPRVSKVRQRPHHQTNGLTSKTIAVHVRCKSLYISLPSCKTTKTKWNDQVLGILENVNDSG